MPTSRRWKPFNKIYAILTVLWIAYLALIVPIQLRHRAETRLGERMAGCVHLDKDHKVAYDGPCMDIAEHLYVIDKNAGVRYFSPAGLMELFIAAFGLPLALYGLMTGLVFFIRHFRMTHPGGPPQNTEA